jgi:hypothetical protein
LRATIRIRACLHRRAAEAATYPALAAVTAKARD